MRRSHRRTIPALLATLALLCGLAGAPPAAAACTQQTVTIGIVEATGCFTARTPSGDTQPVYDVTQPFMMNGFTVTPQDGVTVTFQPPAGNRGASVTTAKGFVDLSVTSQTGRWGTINFKNMAFAFAPPKTGEVVLAESALAQPFPGFSGLSPLNVKQPIRLTEDGAAFDLSFDIGGLFVDMVTGTEKELAASVGFTVKDGTFTISSGKFRVGTFEVAKLFTINELSAEFGADKIDIDADGTFKALNGKGIVLGGTYENKKLTRLQAGVSGLNIALGSSGVYLQKLAAALYLNPFGASGTIDFTAGPKTRFFFKDVTAVEADGTVKMSAADVPNKKPGYFSVGGNFSLMTLPIGNASFAYYFGQGTSMSASIGIGLPSGKNDPGQPTYVGGGFSGWTSARHFDLEGNAQLKLLGVNLLGAKTVVSDIGMAGCLQVVAWIGGGIRWSDGRGELLGGWTCNLGGYQPQPGALQKLGDGSSPLQLGAREKVVRVFAESGEEAPRIALEHADGRRIAAPPAGDEDGLVRFDDGAAISSDNGMTALVIKGDAGGDWRLRRLPGSSDVARIETAPLLPDHDVRASISGSGRTKVLRWDARDIRHQRLQFSEVLPDGREVPILETGKEQGRHRFVPVEGTGTFGVTRKLVVDVMQRYNTPRDEVVADRYQVDRQPAPRPVRKLRVHREVGDLVAQWRTSPGAAGYRVSATAEGAGATYSRDVPASRHRVRLPVGTSGHMTVQVTAVNAQNRSSEAVTRRLDTDNLVPTLKAAARDAVTGGRLGGAREVTLDVPCPDGASCRGVATVERKGRTVGATRFTVPPDLTDRVAVPLTDRAQGRLTLTVSLHQPGEGATATRRLR